MELRSGCLFLPLVCLLAVCLLCGVPAAFAAPLLAPEETTLFIATDLHYLSPRLGVEGAAYEAASNPKDGKSTRYIELLTDALIDTVIRQQPDALIFSGDLTFNGERLSHEDLAAKLARIDPMVTRVYVIPGNHDINNVFAARFTGDRAQPAEYVSPAQFAEIYADFGEALADFSSSNTLDYMVRNEKGPWLLMLDTCIYRSNVQNGSPAMGGRANDLLFSWIERMAAKAQAAGRPLISVTHHSLLPHHPRLQSGYVIENNAELIDLLNRIGVRVNLSGHVHNQDIAEHDGLYDIATEALCVYPHQYGVLRYAGEIIEYETRQVDLAAYAKAQGATDPNLLDYDAYAIRHLGETLSDMRSRIAPGDFTPEQREAMLELIRQVNRRYFAGEAIPEEYREQDAYRLMADSGGWLRDYVEHAAGEDGVDDQRLRLTLAPAPARTAAPAPAVHAPGTYQTITAEQAYAMMRDGHPYLLLDVRTQEEYDTQRIEGAALIPDFELAARAAAELPDKSARILVYCRSGRRSANSAQLLAEAGYTNVYDFGGIQSWPYETTGGSDILMEE